MSETSGQDKAGNERMNDDEITVGWRAKPHPFGSVSAVPVRRRKSDAERAMTNMLRLAETASEFEDCKNSLKRQPRFAVNTAFNCHHRLPRRKVEVYLVIELA
jgi:hypothetical protein